MKYRLNVEKDVDIDSEGTEWECYILNLPKGFRFSDEIVHVRGYDTFEELIKSSQRDVISCNCKDCI